MCQMWQQIRQGVRWKPKMQLALACRGLNLKDVRQVKISMDPFHTQNESLRTFWHAISAPKIRATNPSLRVIPQFRNDGQDPFFEADLADGRKVVFKTAGMNSTDVAMRFNRLLGNPEIGKAGIRPPLQ